MRTVSSEIIVACWWLRPLTAANLYACSVTHPSSRCLPESSLLAAACLYIDRQIDRETVSSHPLYLCLLNTRNSSLLGLKMSQVYKSVATTMADQAPSPVHSQPRTITWWPKAAPILIVIPTALNIAVLCVHSKTYSGQLLSWSVNNRGAVQVVIQVISSILSFFWVYSIRTAISQWTRYRLSGFQVKLNTLRLWSAISSAATNWNLPWSKALIALGFFAFTLLPATLWAGALTPELTEKMQNVSIRGQYCIH